MTTLVEGDLTFEFPAECKASRYDSWAFYRRHFNRIAGGSKAVDFLCMDGSRTWLIEVKDHSIHPRTKPSELHEDVVVKVRDTLAGLAAAQANANDQTEREIARYALGKPWRVVLHLEQPTVPSKLRPKVTDPATLQMKLRQAVRAIDPHAKVVSATAGTVVPWTTYRSGANRPR